MLSVTTSLRTDVSSGKAKSKNLEKRLEEVEEDSVLQVLQRQGPLLVVVTQEHYLNLVSKLAAYEHVTDRDSAVEVPSAEVTARILAADTPGR